MVATLSQPSYEATAVRVGYCSQCRSKGNISGGGGGSTRAPEARAARGVWGMVPLKILKSKGLEMLFPAFSKSYL